MKTKTNRVHDLTYYEWSILRWATSDTRNVLDATGIGIYRELLDRCYAQGSIPSDPELQARIAKCTVPQLASVWVFIKSNFRALKNRPDRLENPAATTYRSNNFRFRDGQIRSGSNGGRAKASKKNDIARQPTRLLEKPSSHLLTNLHTVPTIPTATNEPAAILQQFGQWLETAKAIHETDAAADSMFIERIASAAGAAFASVDHPKCEFSDKVLADAVRYCKQAKPKQSGAGLFLSTVPICIRTWATEGKARDSPKRDPALSDLPYYNLGPRPAE